MPLRPLLPAVSDTPAAAAPGRRDVLAGLAGAGLALSACQPKVDIRKSGGFVVGSTATGVPFSFLDVRTNGLTGAMVDIAKAVAAEAGFPVEMQVSSFSALIPSLTARKIDIIAAAMLRTPEREKVVDFSTPVYAYGGAIVAPVAEAGRFNSLQQLKGLRVGAQVGTRFVDQLDAAGVEGLKTYDSLADILRDLRLGRLDIAYGDEPIIRYYLRVTRSETLAIAAGYRPAELEEVGLIVRKGEVELLKRLNAAIGRIKATKIAEVLRTWGL
ncbi:substrate-binding periplasmic protein [Phenylobacterium sp.]|uniref:substrate-binding periplasmic protein n=1 Tax=Phenylobacterium sp. TaxID=1871053 RepID=UPI0037837653